MHTRNQRARVPEFSRFWLLVSIGTRLLVGSTADAAVITVAQDGTGDYETVADALEAASNDDEVQIYPGLYDESIDGETQEVRLEGTNLRVAGMGSPESTQILGLRIWLQDCGIDIDRVTMANSLSAIIAFTDVVVEINIRDCVFKDNTAFVGSGGAIYAANDPEDLQVMTVDNCRFERNQALFGSAAIWSSGQLTVTNSTFLENVGGEGGTVFVANGLDMDGCLFWKNESGSGLGCLAVGDQFDIRNSTFWNNEGPSSLQLFSIDSEGNSVRNCIIGRTIGGFGIWCDNWFPVTCCNLSFNDKGNQGGCHPPSGSGVVYDVDPLFCDEEGGDFRLRSGSPCLPGEQDGQYCETIGAFDEGCGPTPTQETSWGRLKSRFR